jgi:hypothetical protein
LPSDNQKRFWRNPSDGKDVSRSSVHYAGTFKAQSGLGPSARRSRFPKTLRGKAALNTRDFLGLKEARSGLVRHWEIITDNLSKAGWSWGCVSAADRDGQTIWIADAHRGDGKRFVVRAEEKLIAFVELESASCAACSPTACGNIWQHGPRGE